MTERDMDAPVTRRELHEALDNWNGAMIRQLTAALSAMEARLTTKAEQMEQRLLAELARHTSAANEEMRGNVAVVDEQYKDLPARVTRLEAKVFAPPKRKRRKTG